MKFLVLVCVCRCPVLVQKSVFMQLHLFKLRFLWYFFCRWLEKEMNITRTFWPSWLYTGLVWVCLSSSHGRINNRCYKAGSSHWFIVHEAGVGHIHISELAAAQRTLLFCSCSLNTAGTGSHPGGKHLQPGIVLSCIFIFFGWLTEAIELKYSNWEKSRWLCSPDRGCGQRHNRWDLSVEGRERDIQSPNTAKKREQRRYRRRVGSLKIHRHTPTGSQGGPGGPYSIHWSETLPSAIETSPVQTIRRRICVVLLAKQSTCWTRAASIGVMGTYWSILLVFSR